MDECTLPRLAVLGTGLMGRPMAGRLLAAGFPVTVWNRTPAKARPLSEQGATVAPTAPVAIRDAEAVVLMLADAPAIRDTLLSGEAAGLLGGRTVIQMGTIAPAESLELSAALATRGCDYLGPGPGPSRRQRPAGSWSWSAPHPRCSSAGFRSCAPSVPTRD
jgi:3-hydroxyisobutyrate dehydrogenase-like beta-hydroxyacid dehydrogenase